MTNEAKERIVAKAVEYLDRHPDVTVSDALMFGALVELYLFGSPEDKSIVGILGESPLHGLFRQTR